MAAKGEDVLNLQLALEHSSDCGEAVDSLHPVLQTGSDAAFDFHCDICDEDNNYIEAVGYCTDCKDYLCQECFNCHLRPKPSRHHVLLDKHMMPKETLHEQSKDTCTEQRAIHDDTSVLDSDSMSRAVHIDNIIVRMKGDEDVPWITGSVVLPGDKLVIIDHGNNKVKLINLKDNTLMSHFEDNRQMWDITAITDTRVAVTCHRNGTILIINVTNKVTLDHEVKLNDKCHGIACINDTFVITCCRPTTKVEIISRNGELLKTLVPEENNFFDYPYHVAVSPDHQTIYISDYSTSIVTCLDLNGQVKAKYRDGELSRPRGLLVDRNGVIYVCGSWSNNIHKLTSDLTPIQVQIPKSDGLVNPVSVSLRDNMEYGNEQIELYIGMCNSDIVKVYQLN